MTRALSTPNLLYALMFALLSVPPGFAQGGRGHRGMMGDPAHATDMQVFHQLFEHRHQIERQVVRRQDGIETRTESTDPAVTRLLQTHVASMLARVEDGRPIHRRDPLFAELFRFAERIDASYELTERGVRVVETSRDPYVVKLLQAHAQVVSAFVANGRSEMMKDHPLPSADADGAEPHQE